MSRTVNVICDGCGSDIAAQPTFLVLEHGRNPGVSDGRLPGYPSEPLDETRHFCDNKCLADWLENLGRGVAP